MSLNEMKQLTADLWICPQLQVSDLPTVAAKGFRSIINARPDDESPDQPRSEQIRAAAEKAGIHYEHLPVTPNQITDADVSAFAKHLHELPRPVLGFCRTGMRCSMLWSKVAEKEQ